MRDLRVYIQENQRKFKDGDLPNPVIEITDRIPKGELTSFSERIESGRFSFCANDITINNVLNSDFFLDVDSDFLTHGFFTYIHFEGTEIYRGYTRFEDVTFVDSNPKTFSFRTMNWLSLLKTQKTGSTFRLNAYTLEAFKEALINLLRIPNPIFRPYYSRDLEFDVDGLEDLDFKAYLGWYEIGDSVDEYFIFDQYQDIWQDPRTKKMYAITFERNSGQQKVIVWELIAQDRIKLASLDISGINPRYRMNLEERNVKFIRSNLADGIIGFVAKCSNIDISVSDRWIVATYRLRNGDLVSYTTASRELDVSHYLVRPDGDLVSYGVPIITDGYRVVKIEAVTGGYRLAFYAGLTSSIASYSPVFSALSESAISMPDKDLIVFYGSLSGNWQYFTFSDTTVRTGALLPRPETTPYLATILAIYPMASSDSRYYGQYCYWIEYNPLIIEVYSGFTNDPFFLVFSGLRYDNPITLMDLLMDFAQAFNCYLYTNNGKLFIKNREKGNKEFTFSTDYISREGYKRQLSDESGKDTFLSFVSKYFVDRGNNPLEPKNFSGILSNYYRNTYAVKWVNRNITLPLIAGYLVNLGDKIIIQETAEQGLVIEKSIDFQVGMINFVTESKR